MNEFGSGWGGAAWIQSSRAGGGVATRIYVDLRRSKLAAGTGEGTRNCTSRSDDVPRHECGGYAGQAECLSYLADVVLLPMQRGVGLDNDVLVRGLLELVDQHGFARLQGFGDFGMHAQREIRRFVIGGGDGHLARFRLNFVAERGDGLYHTGAGAVRARLAEHALKRLCGAFARDADEAEFVEGQRFGWGFVLLEGLLQRHENLFAVAALFHVDEVDHDDAAEVAQANLSDDFLHSFEVGLDDGVLEAGGTFADEFSGVDVDGHERFGVIDNDVAAGFEPHFRAQRFVELVLDAELLEDRRFLAVQLDAIDELGLEAADEFDDLPVFLFAIDPDGGEIVADVIAKDALDEIQVAVQKRGRFALLAALLDFVPGLAEEFDVGANFFVGGSAGRGSNDEAAGISAASFADQTTQTRAIIGGRDFARYTDVVDRGHVDQEATRQCHVAGDASAFFAERLLGDLDDDVLPGLQHFGNELRTARRSGVAAMMTMLAAAGAPFESRTSAGTAASAIWPATTAATIVSAAIIAIPSAA